MARSRSASDFATYSDFNIARQDLNCPLSNFTVAYKNLATGKKRGCQLPMMQTLLPLPRGGWANQSASTWRHSLYVRHLTAPSSPLSGNGGTVRLCVL